MNQKDIESRITVLEKEISSLKTRFARVETGEPWWRQRVGLFESDPDHEEAMRLGREWRDSHRSSSEDNGQ